MISARFSLPLLLLATLQFPAADPVSAQDRQAIAAADAQARADRAFVDDDYATAEELYRDVLVSYPHRPHVLSRLGLLLTWKGDYPEAIRLYRKAISLDPSRFEDRVGLATALKWSEDYEAAIDLYRELLSERPGDERLGLEMAQAQAWSGDFSAAMDTLHEMVGRNPANIEARLLLARVHFWEGDTDEAKGVFRSILAEQPDSTDALNGLGQVLAAEGRLKESLETFDRALALDPRNEDALNGRAQAYYWQGDTVEALEAIRRALELYPDARDARRLGRAIGGPLRPTLQLFGSTTQDNDDNDLSTWGGIYTHHLGGRSYVGFDYTHAQTTATLGTLTPVAKYDSLRLRAGRHLSRHVSLYAEAGAERTSFPFDRPGDDPTGSNQHAAGSITLEVTGGDWFTVVASASQERLVGTSQAFMNDVGIRAVTLTTVFSPHPSLRLSVAGQKADFTDEDDYDVDFNFNQVPDAGVDNERDLVRADVRWKLPLRRPGIWLKYGFRWMSYEFTLDHGYFDPDHFVSNVAGFDISDVIGEHLYWGLGMDRGFQRIDDNDDDTVYSYRVLAGLNLGQSASVEAYYSRSDLALQSTAGFTSTEAGVRLRLRFGQGLGPAAPQRQRPARPGRANE